MDLIFEAAANRRQCGAEISVNDLKMQCTFSSSKTVKIPEGLSYSDGRLELIEGAPATTLAICQNHEARLKNAFKELFDEV